MGDDIRNRLSLGSAIKATHYLKAQRIRRKMQEYFLNIFKAADALVTPQVPITAPKLDEKKVILGKRPEEVPSALTRFTRIFNLNGFPCLSLPCGFSSSGMPIGLQVVGRPFDEETVLKVGHAYESQAPWKTQHPKIS
jgi:aspartyl-tRNA(Asn)/glutamyl-tRNA(Gln) amidotransferase subunit A